MEVVALKIGEPLPREQYEYFKKYVSEARRKKVSRFVRYEDAVRSLLAEVLARIFISKHLNIKSKNITFIEDKYGKPWIDGEFENKFYFNLSHSGDWIMLGIDIAHIGVDVEKVRPIEFDIAERFFSKDECRDLLAIEDEKERLNYFFTLWSLKESYIKNDGRGLSIGLDAFSIFKINECTFGIETKDKKLNSSCFFRLYNNIDNEYKFAVCSSKTEPVKSISIVNIEQCVSLIGKI